MTDYKVRCTLDRYLSPLRTIGSPAGDHDLFERLPRSVASDAVDEQAHIKRPCEKC